MDRRLGQRVLILILELNQESSQVLLIEVPVLQRVQYREARNRVEIIHFLQFALFNLYFDVVVDLFFEEATQLELNVGLEPLTLLNSVILPLSYFGAKLDVSIR